MSRTVNPPPATTRCQRLLLTGAAGGLGQVLRPRLKPHTNMLRVSDVAPLAPAGAGEEAMPCDLADAAAVSTLVQGVDAIVHLGGVSVERPFEDILP
ncbi:MAG: NAD-dependent epimerase/dehydratase family protein, partial [Alcaligenes sp.]